MDAKTPKTPRVVSKPRAKKVALATGASGADRASARLSIKAHANAEVYGRLPAPDDSRQVRRRTLRLAQKKLTASLNRQLIAGRRQTKKKVA